jgi:hypothetical protein
VHDFPDPTVGKAIPYGVYDLGANTGWVSVSCDHDTAAFAVATLRRWWQQAGRALYPTATRLLVTADAGGSNGYRVRVWKTELARFAAETGLAVTVCHLPPGTSKWNKIEHRLPHLHELAGPATGLPRGDRPVDRRDPDPLGSQGLRRAGPRPLAAGRQGLRPGAGRRAAPAARLARGVELHHPPAAA